MSYVCVFHLLSNLATRIEDNVSVWLCNFRIVHHLQPFASEQWIRETFRDTVNIQHMAGVWICLVSWFGWSLGPWGFVAFVVVDCCFSLLLIVPQGKQKVDLFQHMNAQNKVGGSGRGSAPNGVDGGSHKVLRCRISMTSLIARVMYKPIEHSRASKGWNFILGWVHFDLFLPEFTKKPSKSQTWKKCVGRPRQFVEETWKPV